MPQLLRNDALSGMWQSWEGQSAMNSQGCLLSIYLAQGIQDILNMVLQYGLSYLTVLPLPMTTLIAATEPKSRKRTRTARGPTPESKHMELQMPGEVTSRELTLVSRVSHCRVLTI